MVEAVPADPLTPEQHEQHEHAVTWARNQFVAMATSYSLIFVLSTMFVVYMRHNRSSAFRGDVDAARKIILPAFQPLLLLFSTVSFMYCMYFWLTMLLTETNMTESTLETEVYYSGRLFIMILTMVYMYQKSITTPALQRAVAIMMVLCTYNLPIVWYTSTRCSVDTAYYVPTFTRLPVPILFACAFISPPARASKQAIREYCMFVFIYYSLFYTSNELFRHNKADAGYMIGFIKIFWGSLCPLVIWRILKADTEHWRGLGQRACVLQSLFRQKHNLDEHVSSRGLHVLIEMHRKYIIDFAYLELTQRIGVGSSAMVFKGMLNSKTLVAIKVYTPRVLLDDTVAAFSHEAALCGALHHPNIVKFYGMCVCPPTICLVSELCQGSLDDITRALARRKHSSKRQQMIINLQYMIDATRAVAYLHSFSPAFLHRDIKPANFLVDANCVVKLTDFGESRSIPKTYQGSHTNDTGNTIRVSSTENVWASMQTPTPVISAPERNAMTVRGTADYMAPELIQGRAGTALYGEAADVYSLAITLWDIMHPWDHKYPDANNNHLKIFDGVLGGKRPEIHESCHPEVRRILTEAWEPQPTRRPSAKYILTALENLKRELVSDVAAALAEPIEIKVVSIRKGTLTEKSASGQQLMQRMIDFGFVETPEEACRMGNGLMSAGYLHHVRHIEPFNAAAELFTFDESKLERFHPRNLHKCYPLLSSLGNSSTGIPSDSRVGARSRSSTSSTLTWKLSTRGNYVGGVPRELEECSCRKLGRGQGLERAQRTIFRRNKRWFAVAEESILTEKLLTDEFEQTGESAYGHSSSSMNTSSDLEAAILHPPSDDEEDDGAFMTGRAATPMISIAIAQPMKPKSKRAKS